MEHQFERHDGGCEIMHCHICDGGLAVCTVCRGGEGSLPTECPGQPMTGQQQEDVYAGTLDYKESAGGWHIPPPVWP